MDFYIYIGDIENVYQVIPSKFQQVEREMDIQCKAFADGIIL